MKKVITVVLAATLSISALLYSQISHRTTRLVDESLLGLEVDSTTGALKTVTYPHAEIHSGSAFLVSDKVVKNDGETVVYLITVADTAAWPHFEYFISGQFDTEVDFYEGADRVGTNLQTSWNRNRNSANSAGMTIHEAISGGTTDGTLMIAEQFGIDTGAFGLGGTGGEGQTRNELILKQNTKYLLRVTSRTASNDLTVKFLWYEHTNE